MEEHPKSLLDPGVLRSVLRELAAADVDELEVVVGSARLYIRRDPGTAAAGDAAGSPASPPADAVSEGVPVVAPLTGILYTRPSPAEAPFVTVGARVEVGQVVALIETMKLFNEVTAEIVGEVVALPVPDGTLVEAGQPLMYLAARGEGEER
jgi:acetyl-CoA carboxylase biotin carboxyl carrier protein